jgi:Cu(I)/Ag(I) efflux system membrane protein CusA/SilA
MNSFFKAVIKYRLIIVFLFLSLTYLGFHLFQNIKVEALPDLSDTQVILKVDYSGQSPEIIEEQITNPVSKKLLSLPNVKNVRSFSFFNNAYIYIIFEDNTDLYWARNRINENIYELQKLIPKEANLSLGTDSSGVGWVFQYALTSDTKDLAELKSLQDFYIKPELESVKGVSEIASVGGFDKTYQVTLNPLKMLQYKIDIPFVKNLINKNNNQVGGSVIEMAESEFFVQSGNYLKSISDIQNIPLNINTEQPLFLKDIAIVQESSLGRRGVAELNGEGEVVGGIVVMRYDENATRVINDIKEKIKNIENNIIKDIKFVTVYDRSNLINESIDNLKNKINQEIIAVCIISLIFLFHFRSILISIIVIPITIFLSFIFISFFNLSSNIMSLGGIAISIGAIIDGSIVLIDNFNKHFCVFQETHKRLPNKKEKIELIQNASKEVGGAILSALLIIVVSFLPIFLFENQEGKLFEPFAITKTIVMISSAIVSLIFIPAIACYVFGNKGINEEDNYLNLFFIKVYKKLLNITLTFPKTFLSLFFIIFCFIIIPISNIKTEFMPELQEGDLLYMPSTIAGISSDKASEILHLSNKMIKKVPEVKTTFGKIGRADTSTDPAPLTMIETTIQLKPKSEWREGFTLKDIIAELNKEVNIPSLRNTWVQPIKTRIDMLSTGLKTNLGIKVFGNNIKDIEHTGNDIEKLLLTLPETEYAFAERTLSGNYIEIIPDSHKAAQFNLDQNDINEFIKYAIGGFKITESIQKDERYAITLRYPREYRDNINKLKKSFIPNKKGIYVSLEQVAEIKIRNKPTILKTENGKLYSWVFIESNMETTKYIDKVSTLLKENIIYPEFVYTEFGGEYKSIKRMNDKLMLILPFIFLLIFIILFVLFNSIFKSLLIMLTLPFSALGGLFYLSYLDFDFSIAVIVGFISLFGIAIEFSIVMLIYLDKAVKDSVNIKQSIIDGASKRIRPKLMTVLTLIIGLYPIMLVSDTGNEIMQRIAAPMIGGMITAPILSLFIIPIIYYLFLKNKKEG